MTMNFSFSSMSALPHLKRLELLLVRGAPAGVLNA